MDQRLGSKSWKLDGCGKFYEAILIKGKANTVGLVPVSLYSGNLGS